MKNDTTSEREGENKIIGTVQQLGKRLHEPLVAESHKAFDLIRVRGVSNSVDQLIQVRLSRCREKKAVSRQRAICKRAKQSIHELGDCWIGRER